MKCHNSSDNSKINIMHVRTSHGVHGAERVILGLLKSNDYKKFRVGITLIGNEPKLNKEFLDELKRLGFEATNFVMNGRLDLQAVIKLRRYLKHLHIDLIHCHDFKANFYGLLATMCTGIKRVTTVHGSTKDSLLLRLYLGFNEWILIRFFHKVIVVSEHLNEELKGRIGFNKIAVIKNGIYLDIFNDSQDSKEFAENESDLPSFKGKKVIGVVGRLFPDKGHEVLFKAVQNLLKEFPELVVLVVGDGPHRGYLEQKRKELDLMGHVIFLGTRKDIKKIYEVMDIFVVPSIREGLPMALLEAMLAKKPVVATRVGGIAELLENNRGKLVNPGDSEGLAGEIKTILLNPEEGCSMAGKAASFVVSKYSSETMTRRTESLYCKVLKKGN